jgi:RecA-family ATPase
MDADTPKTSINLAQLELDKSKAQWAADKERRIAENEALNRIQPGDNLDSFPKQA